MVKTRDQKSLILFLETRVVDYAGRIQMAHMSADDTAQAEVWAKAGFIGFGRIACQDINRGGTHWVAFTDEAWDAAHRERRAKGKRMHQKRSYQTTQEEQAYKCPKMRSPKEVLGYSRNLK